LIGSNDAQIVSAGDYQEQSKKIKNTNNMKNKNLIYHLPKLVLVLLITIIVSSCTDSGTENAPITSVKSTNSQVNLEKNSNMNNYLLEFANRKLTYPDRTHKGGGICVAPPHDCFPDIIVYPPKGLDDITLWPYYVELDNHIQNNTVYQFFSEGGNYVYIVDTTVFPEPILMDLRNNIITLNKYQTNDSVRTYYIIY